jgi:hypothetical protein
MKILIDNGHAARGPIVSAVREVRYARHDVPTQLVAAHTRAGHDTRTDRP